MIQLVVVVVLSFFQINLFADTDAIGKAVSEAGINSADPLQVKLNLISHLLNDKRYLWESSPDPNFAKTATFKTTAKSEAQRLVTKYRGKTNSGDPFNPYEFGTMRSPNEMLGQRIGGACETYARTFASRLQRSGVPTENIRIVDAVANDEYRRLCPRGRGSLSSRQYRDGGGHAFVMIKTEAGRWKIVNTTYSPIGNAGIAKGTHRQSLLDIKTGTSTLSSSELTKMMRTLDESDLEISDFPDPKSIEDSLAKNQFVSVPTFNSLPETLPGPPGEKAIHFRDLSVFLIATPDKFPEHRFEQRANLIASGRLDDDTCRFDPKPVDRGGRGNEKAPDVTK